VKLQLTSDTGILNGESTSLLVGSDTDEEILLSVELSRIGKSGVTDLVEGIGRVGDQFTKEDFLSCDIEYISKTVQWKTGEVGVEASSTRMEISCFLSTS